MNDLEMIAELRKRLSPKRFSHSIGVSETAELLAERFHCDTKKAKIAGLLHDLAREVPKNELLPRTQAFSIVVNDVEEAEPVLLHALLGAKLAQTDFGITDPEILQAIMLHTTAGQGMTVLDKIIYLADVIEPGRGFKGVDQIRELAKTDLDKALLMALDQSIEYLIKRCGLIHPATIAARNEMLLAKISC